MSLWLIILGALQAAMASTAMAGALPQDPIQSTYVTVGPNGHSVARAVTTAAECPALWANGLAQVMRVRAAPGTEPLRPTRSTPENSKPSAFPVLICEADVPADAHTLTIGDVSLPVPKHDARRIVVIGDTGCRLKASDHAWQACNDPQAYPFALIAARAAAWKPDLVIHVGDYLYRENPCPQDKPGCVGSPWGYGWDAWRADFLDPARPLLEAAPWAMVRGNHENCARGGQGWWRFLDSRPLEAGRDCNDPANDIKGDTSPAYAIPLGEGAQLVVMDLSAVGTDPIKPGDPRIEQVRETWRQLSAFARNASFTFAADHYPILGIAAHQHKTGLRFDAGNEPLQAIFAGLDKHLLPDGVDTLLAGHIHLWEQVDLGGIQPSQFVAGFSGTQEDVVPLPRILPGNVSPAPDAAVRRFSSNVFAFGYMTLERTGRLSWKGEVFSVDGHLLKLCRLHRRRSKCSGP